MTRRGFARVTGAMGVVMLAAGVAAAQPAPPAPALPLSDRNIAVLHIDALGIDPEIVVRLESLFRMELERLASKPMPSRREIDRSLERSPLRRCDGGNKCLSDIGRKLGVDLVVSGNVAALGDSYVVNLKLIDVAAGAELRRIASDPLRGSPDELIDAVRVAAYRLVAPERLLGAVAVLTDLVGAEVLLDGKRVGMTPLPAPLAGLALGEHTVAVRATGYTPFEDKIQVRFQKTTQVVVRLIAAPIATPAGGLVTGRPGPPRPAPTPWYSSTWFYVGVGVAAVVVGGYVGYTLAHDPVVDCEAVPSACGGTP